MKSSKKYFLFSLTEIDLRSSSEQSKLCSEVGGCRHSYRKENPVFKKSPFQRLFKFLLFVFLFMFVVFGFCNLAFAETEINGGEISVDTTWNKDGSPYIIRSSPEGEANFTVDAGVTLSIEAGTVVKFDDGQSIKVLGKVITNGTADDKVYFTSLYDDSVGGDTDYDDEILLSSDTNNSDDFSTDDASSSDLTSGTDGTRGNDLTGVDTTVNIEPKNGDWFGIEVENGGSTEFNYTNVSYSLYAFFYDSGSGSLDNVDIENSRCGIFATSSGIVDVKNSSINNITGSVVMLFDDSNATLDNLSIENVSSAVESFDNSNFILKNSSINNVLDCVVCLFKNNNAELSNLSIKNSYRFALIFGDSNLIFNDSSIDKVSGEVFMTFDNSNLKLNNLSVTNITGSVAEAFDNSHIEIQNTNIENVNDRAIAGFDSSIIDFNNSKLKNLTNEAFAFFGNSDGSGTTTLNVSSSTISDGKSNCIGLYNAVDAKFDKINVQNFLGNGMIFYSNPAVLVTDSNISNNSNGVLSYGANVEVKNSIISNNSSYGISNNPVESGAPEIKAINNWWGDKSGPFNANTNASGTANQVSSNVAFQPWLNSKPGEKPTCCSNVMFLPGLEASRLYRPDYNGGTKRLWEPEDSNNNSDIFLEVDGVPSREDIYTRDVIDRAYVIKFGNIYSSFISSMNEMKKDKQINDWKAIPYDWRLSFDELLSSGREFSDGRIYYAGILSTTSDPYIIRELRCLASSSATGKVTIVAHSNGGLLSKALTNNLGEEASKLIDQIVFVAVPQVGTPQAIGSLLHGFDEGLPMKFFATLFSPTDARELGVNMPSAYNLIPSSQYFNYVSDPVITLDNSALLTSWRAKYGNSINTGGGLYNFLSDQSRESLETKSDLVSAPILNKYLYDSAREIHDTKLDNWSPPEGISLTEIAGWGEETLSGIEYYQGIKTECINSSSFSSCPMYKKVPILEYNPKITFDGDGTVVVPSALWTASSTNVKKYWVDLDDYDTFWTLQKKHADILEVPELNNFIKNIVIQSTSSLPKYISTSTPVNSKLKKRLNFILHSPLSLDLYDEQGNHTGISTSTGEIEENIPGSNYITFGEVKYISVPASSTIYLAMNGYSSGSFTLNIEESQGNTVTASSTFAGIPSSTSTIASMNIPDGNIASTSELAVDINGDGNSEMNLSPILGEIVTPDLSKKNTQKDNVIYSFGGGGWTIPVYSYTKLATSTFKMEGKNENIAILPLKSIKKENNKISSVKSIVNKNNKSTSTKMLSENKSPIASVGSVSVADRILSTISNIITYIEKLINKIFSVI